MFAVLIIVTKKSNEYCLTRSKVEYSLCTWNDPPPSYPNFEDLKLEDFPVASLSDSDMIDISN